MKQEINAMNFINRLEAHYKLFFSLAIALVVFLLTMGNVSVSVNIMLTWISYALGHLILSWITILSCDPIEVQKMARIQDSSRTVIFVFVVGSAVVSLFIVILQMQFIRELAGSDLKYHILLLITSVTCAWWSVHTIFVFRYAHLFYSASDEGKTAQEYAGGLVFPKEKKPDYLDFAYFSFVIGMTFQVSDIAIDSRRIRRLAWMHGVLSFAFNTIIVAFTINIISGLIQK